MYKLYLEQNQTFVGLMFLLFKNSPNNAQRPTNKLKS